MFKNSVFRVSVDTKAWIKCAAIRALKTSAQAALGVLTASTVMDSVDWAFVGSTALFAAITSLLTSIIGLPEVPAVNADGE